jgi:hypothetical protein
MTTVAECADIEQAEVLRSLLADCGIEAFLPDERSVAYPPRLGGFRVQVADGQAEAARKVLAAREA